MFKTIVFDFDGVLHSYVSGWQGAVTIPDPPVPHMAELLHKLADLGYDLAVLSTRALDLEGPRAMREWLESNGFPDVQTAQQKIPAALYVDDRGFRFEGDAQAVLDFVQGGMTPWMDKGRP